jgi:lipoate-protein ligase A
MSEIETLLINKVDKIEQDVTDIKEAVIKNTKDLEYHIKRTDDLQTVVEDFSKLISPLHEDYIAKQAVEKYKKEQKENLEFKFKIPGFIYYILAMLISAGTIITWLIGLK